MAGERGWWHEKAREDNIESIQLENIGNQEILNF
jgi:hypothetical protein